MALLVLDSSAVGVSKAPNDGFVIQLSEIDGLPEGLKIMIPFEQPNATEVYDAIGDALGHVKKKSVVADLSTMRQETARHGLNTTE